MSCPAHIESLLEQDAALVPHGQMSILGKGVGHTNKYPQSTLNRHVVSGFIVQMLLMSVFFMVIITVAVFVEKKNTLYPLGMADTTSLMLGCMVV